MKGSRVKENTSVPQGPFHQTIKNALLTAFGGACTVQNRSYYHKQKRYLGVEKHNFTKVESLRGSAWSSAIFRATFSAKNGRFLEKELVNLGETFTSEKRAQRAAKKAKQRRDNGEFETPPVTSETVLETHFSICVVTPFFEAQPMQRRFGAAYDVIEEAVWPIVAQDRRCTGRPRKWKNVSYVGDRVLSLPSVRFCPFSMNLQLLTPFEWRQRRPPQHGGTAARSGVVHIPTAEEVEKLIQHSKPLSNSQSSQLPDWAVKVDILLKNQRKPKKVIDPAAPALDRLKLSPLGLANLGFKKRRKPPKPVFRDGVMVPPTAVRGAEGVEEDMKRAGSVITGSVQALTHAALSLQRIYRQRLFFKNVRRHKRRQRAALTVQRVYRGHVSRVFSTELYRLLIGSAINIQKIWRGVYYTRKVEEYRQKVTAAAIIMQSVLRMYLAKKLLQWLKDDHGQAIAIQRVARGFIGRCKAKLRRAQRFQTGVLLPAVLRLQCWMRVSLARKLLLALRIEAHHREVVVPAVRLLQRIWRGKVGRKEWRRRHFQMGAVVLIQKTWRGVLPRRRFREALLALRRHQSALTIQRVVRGTFARQVAEFRRRKAHFSSRVVPAVRRIQRLRRVLSHRRTARLVMLRDSAAKAIQQFYRWQREKQKARGMWDHLRTWRKQRAAITIQSAWKTLCAGIRVRMKANEQAARRIKAGMVIQRFWRGYLGRCVAWHKKRVWVAAMARRRVDSCVEDTMEIKTDLVDAKEDHKYAMRVLNRCHRRVKRLKSLRRTMEERLPVVEAELEGLDEVEIEQGWAEAYDTEWDVLTNCLGMTEEEILGKKVQIATLERQLQAFMLEREDLEWDLLDVGAGGCASYRQQTFQIALTAVEQNRAREIRWCEDACVDAQNAAARHQKNVWRVKDVRLGVVRRYAGEELRKRAAEARDFHQKLDKEALSVADLRQVQRHQREAAEKKAAEESHAKASLFVPGKGKPPLYPPLVLPSVIKTSAIVLEHNSDDPLVREQLKQEEILNQRLLERSERARSVAFEKRRQIRRNRARRAEQDGEAIHETFVADVWEKGFRRREMQTTLDNLDAIVKRATAKFAFQQKMDFDKVDFRTDPTKMCFVCGMVVKHCVCKKSPDRPKADPSEEAEEAEGGAKESKRKKKKRRMDPELQKLLDYDPVELSTCDF